MPGIEDLLSALFGAPPAQAAQATDDSAMPTAFNAPANPPIPPANPFRQMTPNGQIANPDTTGALGSPAATPTGAPSPAGQVLATLKPKAQQATGPARAPNVQAGKTAANLMQSLMGAFGEKSEAATGKWQAFSNGFTAGNKGAAAAAAAALKADSDKIKATRDQLKEAFELKLKANADQRAQLKQAFDQGQTGVVNTRENRKLDIQESGKDKSKSDPIGDIKKAEEAKRTLYQRLGLDADDKKDQFSKLPAEKRQALEKQYQDGAARIDGALNAGKSGKAAAAAAAPDATPDQGAAAETWHPLVNNDTGETKYYNPATKAWSDTDPRVSQPNVSDLKATKPDTTADDEEE